MSSGFYEARKVLKEVMAEEIRWMRHRPGDHKERRCNPWMPFQPADFTAIMSECVAEAEGNAFLDVGCGPGTKLMVASTLFGLDAAGIEIDPDMAAVCARRGYPVFTGDALTYNAYDAADVIWMYRPFRDQMSQLRLEHLVYAHAKPGAVVAGAMLDHRPEGWEIVIDDWDLRRGAWKKPLGWENITYDIDWSELA